MDEKTRLRLLHGELAAAEAEAARRRLAGDPEAKAAQERLERAWQAVGPDPAVLPRLGFATAVMARARAEGKPGASVGWSFAPVWAKAAAIVALAAGVALGSSLMSLGGETPASSAIAGDRTTTTFVQTSETLAEDYAAALQNPLDDDASSSEARQ